MPITADTDPIFPECPTYGFTMTPQYLVKVVRREAGYERRDRKWRYPLHRYDAVPMGEQPEADIQSVLNFWHAVGGMSTRFRFKDWADYKSCRLGTDATPLDQPFSFVSGSPGGYQLVKQYVYGSITQVRLITKPIGSSLMVANNSGVLQPQTAYTIEEATGLLIPNGGFTGTPASWGGEFYVPVTFTSDLQIELTNYKVQRANFSLSEVRVEPLV